MSEYHKIEIKHWFNGKVLFELEIENNTVAKTLQEALKVGANLYGANLRGANLRGANLRGANLCDANLYGANLYGANLRDANLYGANLRGANLCDANLCDANLRDANLRDADLYGANLRGANNAELALAQTLIVGEGDVIGWKKCKDNLIVKLLIPKEAKRHNATGRKCRAEFADVLEIIDSTDKQKKPTQAVSNYNNKIIYEVGKRVIPNQYEPDRMIECAGGIHFFITKLEAINYND